MSDVRGVMQRSGGAVGCETACDFRAEGRIDGNFRSGKGKGSMLGLAK